MTIRMKEVESKPWEDIQNALENITGGKIGASTLQIRYTRMKANFVVFDKLDEPRIFQVKKEIEERFETEKWQKIADWIEANGGSKCPSTTVQKKFKALTKKSTEHGAAVATTMEEK